MIAVFLIFFCRLHNGENDEKSEAELGRIQHLHEIKSSLEIILALGSIDNLIVYFTPIHKNCIPNQVIINCTVAWYRMMKMQMTFKPQYFARLLQYSAVAALVLQSADVEADE